MISSYWFFNSIDLANLISFSDIIKIFSETLNFFVFISGQMWVSISLLLISLMWVRYYRDLIRDLSSVWDGRERAIPACKNRMNHEVKQAKKNKPRKRDQVMNLTFSTEAVLTKQVEMPACSPHHTLDVFSNLAAAFGLEPLLFLSLPLSLSVRLFLFINFTHTQSLRYKWACGEINVL